MTSESDDKKVVQEYLSDMYAGSTLEKVSCNLARELLFHWIHQMNPEYALYDKQAREKLLLLCRGAHQVPGAHMIEATFTTELESVVYDKLWEMWSFIAKNWPEEKEEEK